VKAVLAAAIGIVPGLLFLAIGNSWPWCILLMALGAFIGAACSLANISPRRAATLTAGTIISYNVPAPLREKVLDAFYGEEDGPQQPNDVS
jgi:hypothetical protein